MDNSLGSAWHNSNSIAAQVSLWHTLKQTVKLNDGKQMADKVAYKIIEMAMSGYMHRIKERSKQRVDERAAVKDKVKTCPGEVEAWHDAEIAKASNMDVSDILKKMKLRDPYVSIYSVVHK